MLAGYGITDLVGIIGSLMICSAYFAVSTGRMNGEALRFQLLNAGGAILLLVSLYYRPNPGAILIEAIWLMIAFAAIARILLRRRERPRGRARCPNDTPAHRGRRRFLDSGRRPTMHDITGKKIAILATDGFEQSELIKPKRQLTQAGATVHVVAPESGSIRGWARTDWGESVPVDVTLDDARAEDYDALVLPGGQINPDVLRTNEKAVKLVRAFFEAGKPLAAICHGPWLLVEADVLKGRRVTSYHSIRTDVRNAGAEWVDEEVVVDQGLVTSRHPGDLDAFCAKIAEEVAEGRHERRRVA